MNERRARTLAVAGAAVLALGIFLPTLRFELTNWDDVDYVIANPTLVSGRLHEIVDPATTTADAWTPLTLASFALERAIGGLEPALYHGTNVLVHTANASLVVAVLLGSGTSPVGAFFGGALFAVHPLQVESVAWVSGRKNLLSTLFLLLSLLAFRRGGRGPWIAGTISGVLAMLAKPTAVVVVPLVLLDRIRACAQRNGWARATRPAWLGREGARLLPLAAAALALGLLATVQQADARADIALHPLWVRALTMSEVLLAYGRRLVAPFGLSAHYPVSPVGPGDTAAIACLAMVILGFGAAAWALRRSPPALFLLAWVPAAAFPHLNLVAGPFWMADRYAYVPIVGVAGLLGLALERGTRPDARGRAIWIAAAAVTLLVLGGVSVDRSRIWRSSRALWNDTLARVPDFLEGHLNLGTALAYEKDHVGAAQAYRRALVIRPDHPGALASLGNELDALGRRDEARDLYRRALALDAESWEATYNLALVEQEEGRLAEAARLYERATELDPASWLTWNNLGNTYRDQGREEAALDAYRRSLDANPAYAPALANLADGLRRGGQGTEAERLYLEAIRADPDFARPHYGIATLYASRGDLLAARTHLRRALEIQPDLEIARRSLARIEEHLERIRGAR